MEDKASVDTTRAHLLLIEDDESLAQTLTEIFGVEGFTVVACGNAADSLTCLAQDRFEVMVVDLHLPDMDEPRFLWEIGPYFEKVATIINTGFSSYESAKAALNLGALAYVEKKDNVQELVRHVHRALHTQLRKQSAKALNRRADFEAIIAHISSNMLRAEDQVLDAMICEALERIGRFCGVDRAYVCELQEDGIYVTNTHEWCDQGITPQIEQLQNIAMDTELPWFAGHMRQREAFLVESVEDLPPEAGPEQRYFQAQGLRSLVVVPMAIKEKLLGFFGFNVVKTLRTWSQEDLGLLTITGELFAGALHRRHVTHDLNAACDRAQMYLDVAGTILVALDTEQRVTLINQKGAEILAFDQEKIIGQKWCESFILESDRERVSRGFSQLMAGELKHMEYFENAVVDAWGQEYLIAWHNVLLRDPDGHMVGTLSSGQDITNRVKAERQVLAYQAKLKSLASELTLTEERLKRTVATELHDRISQSLVVSKMSLAYLQQSIIDPSLREEVTHIEEMLSEVLEESRSLTSQLSYPALNVLGLPRAIELWIEDEIQLKHGLRTHFADDGADKPLNEDVKAVLFRSIREILNNIIKHAEAGNVDVTLGRENQDVVVEIRDDGIGFDPQIVVQKSCGFGLLSIRESLARLEGRIEIESEKGFGCRVTLRVPLLLQEEAV